MDMDGGSDCVWWDVEILQWVEASRWEKAISYFCKVSFLRIELRKLLKGEMVNFNMNFHW
jgi:hypothetical protein